VHAVGQLWRNKIAINVFTFQVIYQYSSIVTGYEFDFAYPEPAATATEYLAVFGLELLNFSPPECINPDSNFYTRLCLATLGPEVICVLICVVVRAKNAYFFRDDPALLAEKNLQMWAYSLVFLEFVLNTVTTVIFKTFNCDQVVGGNRYLVEQPVVSCESSPIRQWWLAFATVNILIYPVGIPLLIFSLLFVRRNKIKRVMRVKKAIDMGAIPDGDEDPEHHHTKSIYDEVSGGELGQEVTIKMIARSDTLERRRRKTAEPNANQEEHNRTAREQHEFNLGRSVSQRALFAGVVDDDDKLEVSPLLLSMAHLFEKFEADAFWYGVFLISTRLLETSMLVFLPNRMCKATLATFVSILALAVLRQYKPWLRDSDDHVAHVAHWVLYIWLYSLQAYDALSQMPPHWWGTPLVVAAVWLLVYTVYKCRLDLKELEAKAPSSSPEGTEIEAPAAVSAGEDVENLADEKTEEKEEEEKADEQEIAESATDDSGAMGAYMRALGCGETALADERAVLFCAASEEDKETSTPVAQDVPMALVAAKSAAANEEDKPS
jgi:hypothetical protein